jgi:hypothetical protein
MNNGMLKLKLTALIMATTALLLACYCIYNEYRYMETIPAKYEQENVRPSTTIHTLPIDTVANTPTNNN